MATKSRAAHSGKHLRHDVMTDDELLCELAALRSALLDRLTALTQGLALHGRIDSLIEHFEYGVSGDTQSLTLDSFRNELEVAAAGHVIFDRPEGA